MQVPRENQSVKHKSERKICMQGIVTSTKGATFFSQSLNIKPYLSNGEDSTIQIEQTFNLKHTVLGSVESFPYWLSLFVHLGNSIASEGLERHLTLWINTYSLPNFFFPPIFFISWRLITLQYCSGCCHTLTSISHGFTCVPHLEPPSHLPLHPIPLGHPSAPAPSTCLMHPTWTGDLFHTW